MRSRSSADLISCLLPLILSALLLVGSTTLKTDIHVEAFQSHHGVSRTYTSTIRPAFIATRRFSLSKNELSTTKEISPVMESKSIVPTITQKDATTTTTSNNNDTAKDQANKWKAEAERIRLEAQEMDLALTVSKIETLERKLNNQVWLTKHPDEVEKLQQQLEFLNSTMHRAEPVTSRTSRSSLSPTKGDQNKDEAALDASDEGANKLERDSPITSITKNDSDESNNNSETDKYLSEESPLCGYDQTDLELYNPVVVAIEARMSDNATIVEKIEAFRAAPELQNHFQEKIQALIVQPMEDISRLESLKDEFLSSSSSVEKRQLKREIDQLEKTMDAESPFLYSDSIFLENLPILQEEEFQQRIEAVGALHPILQALYKVRCGTNVTDDLRLAIELDHFEPQIQVLEQVQYLHDVSKDQRNEIRRALLSLPLSVRDHFAKSLGLDDGEDIPAMMDALISGEQEEWMKLSDIMLTSGDKSDDVSFANSVVGDLSEYNDLDFVDRSRFVQEFIPSLTRLELVYPSLEDVDLLMKEVLDKKAFMAMSKPERVLGGYFIRGRNQFSDMESENNQKMVAFLQAKLQASSLKDKLELFYIQDPAPPTDEEYELDEVVRPVLVVTAKDREQLYNCASPAMKAAISSLGVASAILFGAATTSMQVVMQDQLNAAAAGDMSVDLAPVVSSMFQVTWAILAIQVVHELAHRAIAWKDKFEIGLPTLVPSIQLGLQGAITPFKSPPPDSKSIFDFSIAGPLAGLLVSFLFLIAGMQISSSMDLTDANQLPAFPVGMLKMSTLGGGVVDYFIGGGTLMTSAPEAVLALHPMAIAGFSGMISNALALLPLGNTDGGRISMAMFGRRGAHVVSIMTTLLLCAVGLAGLDEERILLVYTLFAMIWQREAESPALNEVDELDFTRGVFGIAVSSLVLLTLLPII